MIIIDDFLDQEYLKQIQQDIPLLEWGLHGSSPGGNLNFFASYPKDTLYKKLYNKVCNLQEIKYNTNMVSRWYVNCNPSGKQHAGNWHTDCNNGITALFYPMPWNSRMYGGGTAFKNPDETVEYKENRLVLFDGNRLHRAVEHTSNMRYSIAFKIIGEWNEDSINN